MDVDAVAFMAAPIAQPTETDMTDTYWNPAARGWRTDRPTGVIGFHRSLPGYQQTRLVEVPELAAELGVRRVVVKDESSRLGLPAFKILGAAYAISRCLSARFGTPRSASCVSASSNRVE